MIFRQWRWVRVLVILAGIWIGIPVFSIQADPAAGSAGWKEWGTAYWPEPPVRGGTLDVAVPWYIGVFNPNHFPVMDWSTMSIFYDKLILHDGSYKPSIPWLAESWQYTDRLTIEMKLRPNVLFADGSPFTAESLKYQLEWILDKKNGAWTRPWLAPVQSLTIVDQHTIRFHLKHPWGAFAGTMASVPGMVISQKALRMDAAITERRDIARKIGSARRAAEKAKEQADRPSATQPDREAAVRAEAAYTRLQSRLAELEKITRQGQSVDSMPAGAGPYLLDRASPGNYISLKRNSNWWFGKQVGLPDMPYYDFIRIAVVPDPSVRLASLKAGKIDYTLLSPFQHRILKNDKRFHVGVGPLNWLVWLMLNQAEGPCRDIRVRKAISHAIDREALVRGTQAGLGTVASCIFPKNHWARNPKLKPVAYDPALSRKLLAEAGYADGLILRGFTLNTPVSQAFSKAVMGMLAKVGIQWKVDFLGIAAMVKPFMKRDYDMSGGLYQWIFEPDLIATAMYMPDGMLNYGRNRNEEAISLIQQGRETIDDARRREIYRKLEAVLYRNYEDIWLWYPMIVIGSTSNIQGLNIKMLRQYGEGYLRSHPTWFQHPDR